MQLKLDVEHFEELQELFIRETIEQIRFQLIKGGISGTQLRDLTGEIAFSVASTVDDNAGIEFDGVAVKPYLNFAAEEDQLIHCGENSCTHELVASVIDEVFQG